MLLDRLVSDGLIHPPKWLPDNTHYLVRMGSDAYGASSASSDIDVYGFCMPPKDMVFPHLAGEIMGFGRQKQRFEQWSEHHIKTLDGSKEYDFAVYGVVKFFDLVMQNNPNMIDALFVPRRCVMHCTAIGELVRANRKLFLHQGSFSKFRGYAFAQMSKLRTRTQPKSESRRASIAEHGYDVKHGYHVVRLALEAEQILREGNLDLERNSEILKSIRRGEWSLERLEAWFEDKERALESMLAASTIPAEPDEEAIKALLLKCLEHHYGDLAGAVVRRTQVDRLVRDIQAVLDRHAA